MRFSLVGELVRDGGHDYDKVLSVEEYFDAGNLETAIVIAKAMTQSQKLREEKQGNSVSILSGVLKNDMGQVVWKTNLVLRQYHTSIKAEEYFIDERVTI